MKSFGNAQLSIDFSGSGAFYLCARALSASFRTAHRSMKISCATHAVFNPQ